MLRPGRCDDCRMQCAGEPVRCQIGAAAWLIETVTTMGGTLATAHSVAGLWLADPRVCPTEVSA